MAHKTLDEKLFSKIKQRGPDECWDWTGGTDRFGYGKIMFNGKQVNVCSACWQLKHGYFDPSLKKNPSVKHTCNNILCCNVNHMYLNYDDVNRRFWKHVNIQGDEECWNWTGFVHNSGYGQFNLGKRRVYNHLYVYSIHNNVEIPVGVWHNGDKIVHTCNNKLCCNPSHIKKQTSCERFWSYVDIKGKDDCWIWKGSKTNVRYGSFHYNGSIYSSNRMAWILTNGDIPTSNDGKTLEVCHSCDSTFCCNPNHLFLGTHHENMKDMVSKNRQAKGFRNGKCKLSEDAVKEIRKINNKTYKDIAILYGIDDSYAHRIKNNNARIAISDSKDF